MAIPSTQWPRPYWGIWWQWAQHRAPVEPQEVCGLGGLHPLSLLRLSGKVLLELSRDNLNCLPPGSFQGLWRLWVLLLSHCALWDLAGGVLGGRGFLRWLHFSHNQLAHLSLDFFTTLGSVLLLDLSQPAYHPGPLQPVGPGEPGAA